MMGNAPGLWGNCEHILYLGLFQCHFQEITSDCILGKTESRNSSYEVMSIIQFKNGKALHYGTNISETKGWNKKT